MVVSQKIPIEDVKYGDRVNGQQVMEVLHRHNGYVRLVLEDCSVVDGYRGRAYGYEVLNGVDTSLVTVLAKLGGEIDEARGLLGRAMSLAINRMERDCFTDGEWGEFSGAVLEFMDVEHNIEVLKLALGKMCDVSELVEQHNKKCRDSGYTKQKPLKAVRA